MRSPGNQGALSNIARFIPITTRIAIITPVKASPATSPAVNSKPVRIALSLGVISVCLTASSQSLISSSLALPNFFSNLLFVKCLITPPEKIGIDNVNGR